MNFDFQKMNQYHLDVLREVSNVGAGNAATALSKLLKRRVDMGIPTVRWLEFSEVGSILGDEEKIVTGVTVAIEGDLTGLLLLIMEYEDTSRLVEVLTGQKPSSMESLGEIAISAVQETGNILGGAYMSALAMLTNLSVKCTYPDISIDMAAAILNLPAVSYGQIADRVLYIDSNFDEGQDHIKTNMFLVLEAASFEVLLKALGVIQE